MRARQLTRRTGIVGRCMAALTVATGVLGASATATTPTSGSLGRVAESAGLSRGVESLIAEIRKQSFSLEKRGRELARREAAVQEIERLLDERVAEIEQMRDEVERRIERWVSLDGDRVEKLSKVYSSMPPERAALLLSGLELDLSVAIVQHMKKKQSAAVLAAMRSERALVISRRLLEPLDPETDETP